MYDAYEGPLHREIYQLERQLNATTVSANQGGSQIVAASAAAATVATSSANQHNVKTEADKFFDAKDAQSDDGLLDDSNGLPSPPIGNSQRSNDDDALLYSDADDQVIPETQFEASFKNDGGEDKSDNDSNDIPPHQSMGLGNLNNGETKNRPPNAGDSKSAKEKGDDAAGEIGTKKRKLEADGDGDGRGGRKTTAPKKEVEDEHDRSRKGKGKGKNSQPRATVNSNNNNNADGKKRSKNQQHRRNDDDDDHDDDDDWTPGDVMTRKKLRESRDKSPPI